MRALTAAAAVLAATLAFHAAHAQLPATGNDALLEICSGFLEQNRLTISGDAQRLCTCLVREVQGKLSRGEMETYDSYAAAAKPLPGALQNKISGIAVQCLTEAK
ncbi:MAG: hypothetical protein JNK21_05580 [Rhodospirillaceae bacterium]|nr:hypothetical protein [Rhodospirillaceae bacterium]